MLINFAKDPNLRGYVMEYACRILLRRQKKNNFIFLLSQFDSVDEIVKKYRLNCDQVPHIVDFLSKQDCRCDIIEFKLNNTAQRVVEAVGFYEVKTRKHDTQRKTFDACFSNHKFMQSIRTLAGASTYIISVLIFENWRFSFNIYSYDSVELRVYNSQDKSLQRTFAKIET